MVIERVSPSGAWNIYGLVNGYLLSKTYIGYTKKVALRLWRESAREITGK